MAGDFVPFLRLLQPGAAATPTAAPEGFAAAGLQPAAAGPAASTGAAPGHAPQLNLLREGDRVRRIQVRCACGHLIELDCLY